MQNHTLDDDVTIAQGSVEVDSNVGTVLSVDNSATLDVSLGGALAVSGDVVNSGAFDFANAQSTTSPITPASTLTVGGALINTGTINAGNPGLLGFSAPSPGTIAAASLVNDGAIDVVSYAVTLDFGAGGYAQGPSGSLLLSSAGGGFATLATTGGVTLEGGALDVFFTFPTGVAPAAGEGFTIVSFKPGALTGIYDALSVSFDDLDELSGSSGNGVTTGSSDGLTYGLVYNNSAGNITLDASPRRR